MDHTVEILAELRLLREAMARVETRLESQDRMIQEEKGKVVALEARVRALELGQVSRLIGAAAGGGGLSMVLDRLINLIGGN